MKPTFKRDLSAGIFGFVVFSSASLLIYLDDVPSDDMKRDFLFVTIGLSLLFGLGVLYILERKKKEDAAANSRKE
jgi:hypothetical protein